mgnify:CR=1 FL=1
MKAGFRTSQSISDWSPNVIAICYIGTKLHFFVSDNTYLILSLCKNHEDYTVQKTIEENIQKVICKASSLRCPVLLSYYHVMSQGVKKSYWIVRTIRKNADGDVIDGEMSFSSLSSSACETPTLKHYNEENKTMFQCKLSEFKSSCTPCYVGSDSGKQFRMSTSRLTVLTVYTCCLRARSNAECKAMRN